MNQNNFFLVLGPESAGNHVVTEILIQMGCFGDIENEKLDLFVNGQVSLKDAVGKERNVVLIRSVPYGLEWVDVEALRLKVEKANYQLKTIIVVRDWFANFSSNYYHRIDNVRKALDMLERVWIWIGERLAYLEPFYFCNTSLLFKNCEATIEGLEWFTGLKYNHREHFFVRDSDLKHHEIIHTHTFEEFKSLEHIEYKKLLQKTKGDWE